ncbi:hypothetical protein KKG63_03620 [Patescibacteria group bacterium]|nr:hypothetical protein [Patescibacteria group bacterium]MBU1999470.1 hypothetical protein [Candidatus Omnitrophota bacterium]
MKDSIFSDGKPISNEPFDFERALAGGDYFFCKTSILKKNYEKLKWICAKYPMDIELEEVRRVHRQMLNDIEVMESSMQQIYEHACNGKIPAEVLVNFVSLLRNWQGRHIDLREFRNFIEAKTKDLTK